MSSKPDTGRSAAEFEEASEAESQGFVREFWDFLRYNKKWWLTPIVIILLLVAGLAILGSSPAAPFIYTLF